MLAFYLIQIHDSQVWGKTRDNRDGFFLTREVKQSWVFSYCVGDGDARKFSVEG